MQKLRLSSIFKVIKRTGIETAVQVARVLHSLHTSVENPEETDNWKYVSTVTGILLSNIGP